MSVVGVNGSAYGDYYSNQFHASTALFCPPNATGGATGDTSTCTCVTGYGSLDGQTCVAIAAPGTGPQTAACGGTVGKSLFDPGSMTDTDVTGTGATHVDNICGGGCDYRFTGDVQFVVTQGAKTYVSSNSEGYVGSGTACQPGTPGATGTTPQDPSTPVQVEPYPAPLPAGKCPGTVNGAPVVVPCDTVSAPAPSSGTVQGPSTTASSPAGAVPGATTSTGTTTCTATTCTTTTTTTVNNSNGTTTSTPIITTQDRASYCAANAAALVCKGTGDAQDDTSTAGQPTLYTPKTRTLADALSSFKQTVNASPLGASVGNFFAVNGGGVCPTWSGQVPYLNTSITIDQFCSALGTQMLAFMKVALMVVAGFMAFRIAVDN